MRRVHMLLSTLVLIAELALVTWCVFVPHVRIEIL